MKDTQKIAIILRLIRSLEKHRSWCGETHIQKAGYCLQNIMEISTDFDFILYKHGPFSFDLRDELTAMRANELIDINVNTKPYGPSYFITRFGENMMGRFPKTLGRYEKQIDFISERLGDKGVAELERLATALYVTMENGSESTEKRAEQIHRLKPHVSYENALFAVQEIDRIKTEAKEITR